MKTRTVENRIFNYKKALEIGLIISLTVHIFLLQGSKKIDVKSIQFENKLKEIDVINTPLTHHEKKTAAPLKPTIPISSESEELLPDETIDLTTLDLINQTKTLKPPPPPEELPFVAFDKPPIPIGGYGALAKNVKYPEIARKANVEGTLTIAAQIDEKGNVVATRILKSLGPVGCDEAAEKAVRSVKWKPALQRDRKVKVWISIPIVFKLTKS
jgi:protein TonB